LLAIAASAIIFAFDSFQRLSLMMPPAFRCRHCAIAAAARDARRCRCPRCRRRLCATFAIALIIELSS
jgi:predicted Zn-ribbon and HTH transcriptional regulator